MSEQFDRFREQLTLSEKARVWARVSRRIGGGDAATARWRRWWLGPVAAAAAGVALYVVVISNSPEKAPVLHGESREEAPVQGRDQKRSAPALTDAPAERDRDTQALVSSDAAPNPPPQADVLSAQSTAPGGRQATDPVPLPSAASRAAALSEAAIAAHDEPVVAEAEPPVGRLSSVYVTPGEGGVIEGTVRDLEGKPIPYANVMVAGTQWGASTKADGSFEIRNVPPGIYEVKTLMMGFAKVVVDSVAVSQEEGSALAIRLESAPVARLDQVEVLATKEVIDRRSASSVHRIESKDLESMPTDEISEAIDLKAGVIAKGKEIHFRGGRAGEVQYQVDGVQVRDPLKGGGRDLANGQPAEGDADSQYGNAQSGVVEHFAKSEPGSPAQAETWGAVKGLSGESKRRQAPSTVAPAPPSVPITGGNALPNDEPYDAMYFESAGVNPFIDTRDDAQSTFAVDVDRASYNIVRRYIDEGHLPPADAARVEEFVNSFEPGYPTFSNPDFSIEIDGMPAPFRPNYELVRIGIRGRVIEAAQRQPSDLVFVIDVSGSMDREDRLETVKRALGILLSQLDEADRVGIVVYGSSGRVVLEPTWASERGRIHAAIESLHPDGSTNAEEGLRLGYQMARSMRRSGRETRILLCSDGVANVGRTGPESILETVRSESDRGIYLSTIGFGMGNYNDVLMEQLADTGDGMAYYVDSLDEAERVFVTELSGTLQTIARDAKIQVEFDPSVVESYRLLGFENRDVADRDFRNDAVDAGELGAGHTVTALYEVRLADGARGRDRIGTVRFRWEKPADVGAWRDRSGELTDDVIDDRAPRGPVREIERHIEVRDLAGSVSDGSPYLRLAASAAETAEVLRKSYWAKEHSIEDLLTLARGAARDLERLPAASRGFVDARRPLPDVPPGGASQTAAEQAWDLVRMIERIRDLQAER